MEFIEAHTPEHLENVRELFVEYAESLGFDLCFQDFETELATLPGDYAPPDGRVVLAIHGDQVAGCVALRRFNESACEMKRLYVRPAFRGTGLGRRLAVHIIEQAGQIGYDEMLLDTVPRMTEAIALYESLGFEETRSYRHNPIEGTKFMRLAL
jgi:ribosomal protein S18 acetylase RimI-like enzyme